MRKLLALALLLPTLALGATWTIVTVGPAANTGSSTQNLTGTAPSTASEGYGVGGRKWCVMTVCAQAGATLTAGGVQGYFYQPFLGLWARSPALDWTLTGGSRCAVAPTLQLANQLGRIEIVPNAVTVSAGTQVTIYLKCTAGTVW